MAAAERGSGPPRPPSLFDSCVAFVAGHVRHVDSLRGFPEDVGRLIWSKWLELAAPPEQDPDGAAALGLFAEAYPRLLLPDLRVTCRRALDEAWFLGGLAAGATRLDCSGLDLRDRHELLRACHGFPHLRVLVLRNNNLGPAGVRNLLGPLHLEGNKGRSFARLRYLDVSANPALAAKDLEKFALLPAIETLLGSLPRAAALSPEFLERFSAERGLRMEPPFRTAGWAADLAEEAQARQEARVPTEKTPLLGSAGREKSELFFFNRRLRRDAKLSPSNILRECNVAGSYGEKDDLLLALYKNGLPR